MTNQSRIGIFCPSRKSSTKSGSERSAAVKLNFFHLSHLPSGFLVMVGSSLTFESMKELAPPSSSPSLHHSQNQPSCRSVHVELVRSSFRTFLVHQRICFFTGCVFLLLVQRSNNPELKKNICTFFFLFFQNPTFSKRPSLMNVILWLQLPAATKRNPDLFRRCQSFPFQPSHF